MIENRERLAWTVLLASFAGFVALLVGIPFGVYQWIQHATVSPLIIVQALAGTAQIELPNSPARFILVDQEPVQIEPSAIVRNDSDTETLLTVSSPDGTDVLCTIQVYPNTQLEITLGESPRYRHSGEPHRVEVLLTTGRIRLGLARWASRPADVRARTPHGQFLLWQAGSYSFDVTSQQSQITVREGKATIVAQSAQLGLSEDQRGVVGVDQDPVGPLPPEKDLVTNGHFSRPMAEGWHSYQDTIDPAQSAGEVELVTTGGQEAVRLFRQGTNHAETGIYQPLNHNLSDYRSLQLHLSAQIDYQSLGICGTLGSECPLMVRLKYRDAGGSEQQWVQGFYYWIDPAASYPELCVQCPVPRQPHEQHSQGVQFFYDSPNLMEMLMRDGLPPISLVEIAVYASGHSYDVQISEIELLVAE